MSAARDHLHVLTPAELRGREDPLPSGWARGEEVEIRSLAEIRATLDARGALDGLPFMPEMERFAGQRVRVHRRADRLCVEGAGELRRLRDTVFLGDLRCGGAAHAGCQRACLLLWKEAWLRRPEDKIGTAAVPSPGAPLPPVSTAPEREGARFSCQSTELFSATEALPAWRLDQYARDLATGNLTPLELAQAFAATAGHRLEMRITRTNRRQRSKTTPREALGLQPGEWVEVKRAEEIGATLDRAQMNRGLEFSPGMSSYCGRRYRVHQRIERMIDEATGVMRKLADTVSLEHLYCDGLCMRGCPRATPLYWREIWLRRVPAP